MIRTILNQEQWERIAPELPGKVGAPGATACDNRRFVEAVLWIARTGAPWRDLLGEFGKWYSVTVTFNSGGSYTYLCSIVCSPLHGNMNGQIVVT